MNSLMGFISSYQIMGIIPLDLTMHLLVGALWTAIGISQNISLKRVFLGLFVLALLKECNDYFFHLTAHYTEYLFDFLITFTFIFFVWVVRKIKAKHDKAAQSTQKWNTY